jgi:restriction system protein
MLSYGQLSMNNEYSLLMSPSLHGARCELSAEADFKKNSQVEKTEKPAYQEMVVEAHRQMMEQLCSELLGYIYVQNHQFFETMVLDVLLALGYGGRRRDLARRLGRSGDGGVDGIIEMDELGLDMIYIQAKRLKPGNAVAVSAVRDFVGSLDAQHAAKGIFVTAGQFTAAAHSLVTIVSKKIVLIDGRRLSELMVRHNIGISPSSTFQFKSVDIAYFDKSSNRKTMSSASIQPRT